MSTVLPFRAAAGSLTNSTSNIFINTKKIILNTPHLTAFTALNSFAVLDGSAIATTDFTTFSLQSDPVGQQRSWGLPFFEGDSVRDITVSLLTGGIDGIVEAVHILTIYQSFNVGMAPMSLESSPKKDVVVYDAATGTIHLLYEVVNLSESTLPDDRSIETEALALARQKIRDPFTAAVLHIDPSAMKRGASYQVDLVSRTLKELPAKQPSLVK